MEPLQPMRPVDVQRDEREAAPRWKVWGAYIGLAALYLASMWIDGDHRWAVVAGACVFAIGAALAIAAARRTSRENAGRRIPWTGVPPVRPRKVDLLETAGVPMALAGSLLAIKNLPIPWPISLLAAAVVCIGVIGVPLAAQVWHNHRVHRSTPNP
jgi:hypothetical protein